MVREAKRRADVRWGNCLSENFERNKKMFWKEVKRVRKGVSGREEKVKSANGQLLVSEREVRERWAEYFEELLNVEDDREANILAVGNGMRVPILGEVNDVAITNEEVKAVLKVIKGGKAPGLDGCPSELLKKGGRAVVEWLVRLMNVCFREGRVPTDWSDACIVPLYKGKGDKYVCSNFRGISLLSVVGKVYGRVLIERIRRETESVIGEEQCGFRSGRGCVDQVFAVRQVVEKYLEKGKDVFWAFMDLEKAYDRIDREALWKVLRLYGVGGRLLNAVKSFYRNSRACVRVGNGESEWFAVNVGLRQGCVMSPWLFNMYMDGVVREVNVRGMDRGLKLDDENGRMWVLNQLLFADDTGLGADSEDRLEQLVNEFGRVCERRKLRVNVGKSKVMRCTRNEGGDRLNVRLNGERLEDVQSFKYLGSHIAVKGGVEEEVRHRVNEASKCLGGLKSVMRNRYLGMSAKRRLYEGVIVPTALYGAETWNIKKAERNKLDVMEMRCLRSMLGVSRMDRVRNVEVRQRTGVVKKLSERVDQSVLRWYGHMVRMDEERLTKKVWRAQVNGGRSRGRPNIRWMDGVSKALDVRGMNVGQGREIARDRNEWRRVVDG
jgi:hypothetical protein